MRIVRGQENRIVLTLTEKATTNNSEWIIQFTNDITGEIKVIGVVDVSEYQERANIFLITESDTENLSYATVKLIAGQWSYEAYEMAPSSPRNLDPDDALESCETGICMVVEDYEVANFTTNEDKNNPVFEG